jgi:carbon monoxide dehydrogenase subunit G
MQLEGNYQFQAPRSVVWEALMDPDVLAQALPGGEQMEKISESEYRAMMNVRVGPVQGKFQGSIELADIVPQEGYRMKVSGQGAPGFITGEGTLRLQENGGGNDPVYTDLIYNGDVQIGGRIAGVSQRLIDSTAKSLTRQGLQALDQHIQDQLNPPAPAAPAAPAATPPVTAASPQPAARSAPHGPSTATIAANVARDVAGDMVTDYIPPDKREKVLYAALGALGMLLFVVLVRLVQK